MKVYCVIMAPSNSAAGSQGRTKEEGCSWSQRRRLGPARVKQCFCDSKSQPGAGLLLSRESDHTCSRCSPPPHPHKASQREVQGVGGFSPAICLQRTIFLEGPSRRDLGETGKEARVRDPRVSSFWVMLGVTSVGKRDETQDEAGKGFVWRGHGSPCGAD